MNYRKAIAVLSLFSAGSVMSISAQAQESFIGEVLIYAGSFCPTGTTPANGALLSVNANQALFSLLGTNFGGDGRIQFGVPDLRGRVPINAGTGPGLSGGSIGNIQGRDFINLTEAQMPSHRHDEPQHIHTIDDHSHTGKFQVHSGGGNTNTPVGSSVATFPAGNLYKGSQPSPSVRMASGTLDIEDAPASNTSVSHPATTPTGSTGNSSPAYMGSPSLAFTVCIATQGLYPSRN